MEFFDVLRARHSIRAYDTRPVEPEKLQQILEAVNGAPSAGNLQAFEVYIVCDEGRKAALVKASGGQEFVAQAPLDLVFCTNAAVSEASYKERGRELLCIQDASIACTFAMLAANALGLSCVWVGSFDEQEVASVIGAPAQIRPIAILPIGYAAETPTIRTRRGVNDLVHRAG